MSRGALGAAALLLITTCVPAALTAQDAKIAKLMDSAEAALEKGRYQDAFEKYLRANQEAEGGRIGAILGALEASLALGRYDAIITQISGASSEDVAEQSQIDALVGRAHLLTAYVVDPSRTPAEREALAEEHRKRAASRLESATGGGGEWAVRSHYYLAEARVALGDVEGASKALEAFLDAGGAGTPESHSANTLAGCLSADRPVHREEPADVLPTKQRGPDPRASTDGRSIVEAVLTTDGKLSCMRMIPPLSEKTNESVYEALARRIYSPAGDAGETIETPYTVTLDFGTN